MTAIIAWSRTTDLVTLAYFVIVAETINKSDGYTIIKTDQPKVRQA